MAVVLRLLGEVTAEVDGRPVDLGAPRQRCVLAALAVDVGRAVPVDRLVERVWGGEVARRAPATLHSYISRLRRALTGADGVAIVRRSGGYALVADAVVDLHRFRLLCGRAREDDAVRSLTEALALWRGEALTGLAGEWVGAVRDRLRQERSAAEHDLVDARLHAGEGAELVAELSARAARHPLDERVAGQYLLALHRAGRTPDALAHYRQVRTRLVEELGAEPREALRELHRRILAADPALAASPPCAAAVVPRQLPAAPVPFVGRRDELARLDVVGTAVTAVVGAGGIGKTWLALHWAHRRLDRFPDGQLFVDLGGDGAPMDPVVAVRGFLDAHGVDRQPTDPHARAALFRSLVAQRRMLLVLDNAADTAQVTPLLPGGRSCAVIVTSRDSLPGLLVGHGAAHVPLDVLSRTESHAFLTARLGAARVREEPRAVAELVGLCGGFPLALGIAAGYACTRPRLPLSALVAELREFDLTSWTDGDLAPGPCGVPSWRRRTSRDQGRLASLSVLAPTSCPTTDRFGSTGDCGAAGRADRWTGPRVR
ncbi:BTAD domain-containing putative transcriptional regulator [Actinosynnema sp. NPDC002837]